MERALNEIDVRLMDHGKRVAYLMFKTLEPQQKFSNKELRDICIVAMLHDIGAYKTEEIDNMVMFETVDVWEHSIYGYLFLKHFSPLKDLAITLLFHHADCHEISKNLSSSDRMISQLISLTDRADVFSVHKAPHDKFKEHIERNRDIKYSSEVVDMFLNSDINMDTIFDNVDTDEAFNQIFRETPLTEEEVEGYINMVIFSIEFRSDQTVNHSIASTCIAELLALKSGKCKEEIGRIRTGAMLHDIGKIGIPLHILEGRGKLSDEDFVIMKSHVDVTNKILDGNVDDDIKNIAIHHHEKLNGTGYPYRLDSKDIPFIERVVSVADIFSALCGVRSYKAAFPKEKIVGILEDNRDSHHLDAEIVNLAIEYYDEIIDAANKASEPVIQAYEDLNTERKHLRESIESSNFDLMYV